MSVKIPRAISASKRFFSSAKTTPEFIKRTTLFKVAEKDIDSVLKQYEVLRKTAVKDGKPYIVSNVATRVLNTASPRSEGYTICSQSIFKNEEDHDFYDKQCAAHQELKEITTKVRQGVMTVVVKTEWPEPLL